MNFGASASSFAITWIREPKCSSGPLGLLCDDRDTQSDSPSGGSAEINAMNPSTSLVDGRVELIVRAQTHAATSLEYDFLDP